MKIAINIVNQIGLGDFIAILLNVLKFASIGEIIRFISWDIFKPKKVKKLIEGIQIGKNWRSAYNEAKKL